MLLCTTMGLNIPLRNLKFNRHIHLMIVDIYLIEKNEDEDK
jgi:hypothetical protein